MIPASGITVEWLPWFQEVARHPARHKYISGGRGILKTTHAVQWLVIETLRAKWQGQGVFTAPTRVEAKRLAWKPLNQFLESLPQKIKIGENATDMTVELIDGKSIALFGMKEFESLRGPHPVALANDEVAKSPQRGFIEVLDPAMASHMGPTLDITTPRRGWWQKRWLEGWGPGRELDSMSWKIKAADVGMISPEELAKFKKRMSPDLFAQEWEGEFTNAQGPVFPQFVDQMWDRGHLMPPGMVRQEMERGGYLLGALDWAFSGTAVWLWIWVTRTGGMIVLDELDCSHKTPAQMVTMAVSRRKLPPLTVLDSRCWGLERDGRSVAEDFQRHGRKYGAAFVKADKRFPDSIVKLNDLMTMDEDATKFPSFAIQADKAPLLRAQLNDLQEEDVRVGGGGFRDGAACDSADAVRYGAMALLSGHSRPSREHVDPEVARTRLKPLTRADVEEDEIIGWDDNSGVPIFKGEAADA